MKRKPVDTVQGAMLAHARAIAERRAANRAKWRAQAAEQGRRGALKRWQKAKQCALDGDKPQ